MCGCNAHVFARLWVLIVTDRSDYSVHLDIVDAWDRGMGLSVPPRESHTPPQWRRSTFRIGGQVRGPKGR